MELIVAPDRLPETMSALKGEKKRVPMTASVPVEHLVIIVKENHTFDSYFGTFPGANGVTGLPRALDQPPFDPRHDRHAWLHSADPPPHSALTHRCVRLTCSTVVPA